MPIGQLKEILLLILAIAPGVVFIFIGLRFLVDTEDFNLRKLYRALTGKRSWRGFTRLIGLVCILIGILLSYWLIWPRIEEIFELNAGLTQGLFLAVLQLLPAGG